MTINRQGGIVLRLRLIGHMEAWNVAGLNVLPAERESRALLAAIALSAPRKVSRRWLTELLRGARSNPRASIRREIRDLLATQQPAGTEFLVVTRDYLSLRPGAVWIDVEQIRLATATRPEALSLLDRGLLEDLDEIAPGFDNWLKAEWEQLRDHARGVAEECLLAPGETDAIIPSARRLLLLDPVHEGAWRALMRAFADRGEHDKAIQAFEACRRALAETLDLAPAAETRALLAEISDPPAKRPKESPPLFGVSEPEPTLPAAKQTPPDWPRVGVPPLRCIGLREDEALLGEHLAHEITACLSRYFRLTVTASDALARFARHSRDEAAIRRAFGVNYLLDGTIQRGPDGLRVSLRLLDLRAANQVVWAERFDRPAQDLPATLAGIASEAAARIEPELQLIEASRIRDAPAETLSANDLLMRTLPLITRMDREGFFRAGCWLEQAIERDPTFCDAHTWYAFWHILLVSQGWAPDPFAALSRGNELAEHGVALNPVAGRTLAIAGLLRAQSGDFSAATALYDRALRANPNLPMIWAFSAATRVYQGQIDEARRLFETYQVLSPHNHFSFIYEAFFAPIHLIGRDYHTAIATGHRLVQLNPLFSAGFKPHLAALGHLGRHREAVSVLKRLLAVEPSFTIRHFLATTPLARQSDRDHFADGLRLAGVSCASTYEL